MRPLSTWKCLVLGGASALLQWLAVFPVNAGWLGWVALVPLLITTRCETTRRGRWLAASAAGLGFFVPAISWMRFADPMMVYAWLGLSLYCSLYVPLAMWMIRRFGSWLPLALTVPVVWTALELVRGHLFGGFPWYLLGHTQHDNPFSIQLADLGGVGLITFVVASVNGAIVDATSWRYRTAIAVGVLVVATFGYGAWRSSQTAFAVGPRIAMLQGNIPQNVRNEAALTNAEQATKDIVGHFVALHQQAAAAAADLIVWPETSLPYEFVFATPGTTASDYGTLANAVEQTALLVPQFGTISRTPNLLGTSCRDIHPGGANTRYNSAILVDRTGEIRGRYNKIHRVPLGEFVPLRDSLPWLKKLTPYGDEYDYSIDAGKEYTRFPLTAGNREYHFGVLICYDDSFSSLGTAYVNGGNRVDFLVNISNDGWFKGSAEHEQHLAVCRFRAVECRRAVVRAVNMGISAVIDSNGRIVNLPGKSWAESKAMSDVLVAAVPIDDRTSVYASVGDWPAWLCWALVFVGIGATRAGSPTRA